MRKMKTAWTEKDNQRLLKMVAEGASPLRVAGAFNRSMISVRVQARKLGMPFRKRKADLDDQSIDVVEPMASLAE
jgi:hypothetical protein